MGAKYSSKPTASDVLLGQTACVAEVCLLGDDIILADKVVRIYMEHPTTSIHAHTHVQ